MQWFTIDFNRHVDNCWPKSLAETEMVVLMKCCMTVLRKILDAANYRMQHSGITISLEKMLNDYFEVSGYDPINHDATKEIYIEDGSVSEELYIYQDNESQSSFLKDDGINSADDVFLDNDAEGGINFNWIVWMPVSIIFEEPKLRAVIDSYRYIGTPYTIQTY